MLTNTEALESFVQFCDTMEIANEGLFARQVSIKNATDVSTESDLKMEIRSETNLIHITGPKARNLL